MKILRFAAGGDAPVYGILEGDTIRPITGDPFGPLMLTGPPVRLEDVRLLIPVVASKVLCVGANYTTYSLSGGIPTFSMKVPTACVATEEPVPYPRLSERVIMEAELAIVIRSVAKDVAVEDALDHVLGYTVANDFTARDLMQKDGRPCRAKNFDGFCPIGPVVETELDVSDIRIRGRVNGTVEQEGWTRDMIATVPQVVSMFSEVMTLLPGDVILTATPSPPPYVNIGDVVEAEVEGIGVLRNPVVAPTLGRALGGEPSRTG
jgi:2-keto-4-pentenoate hydratase/2-oxohepta-3-ene-1,7-dioic acid hydratase in catechol pathway